MILSTHISWGCYSHSPTSTLRNTVFSFHISSTAFDSDESDTYYFSSVLALLKRSLTHLFHMDTSVRSTTFDIWSDHSSRKRLSERAFQRFFFSYLPSYYHTHPHEVEMVSILHSRILGKRWERKKCIITNAPNHENLHLHLHLHCLSTFSEILVFGASCIHESKT